MDAHPPRRYRTCYAVGMPSDTSFTGAIPERYAHTLEPMFFVPYARDLVARARTGAPRRVLEVAAGTGVVTRALAEALPEAEILATDLNPDMVAYGASRGGPGATWSTADALALPFEDGRFDLVVCQFGVMFFPDRARAFREVRRVLAPGGRYLFNVWDDLAHNDVARLVNEAVKSAFPEDPPRFIERVPHGHGDPAPIEAELRAAGFHEVGWEPVSARSRCPTAREAAAGLCEGTPLFHEITRRDPARLPVVVDAAARLLAASLGEGPGGIDGGLRAFVFSAA